MTDTETRTEEFRLLAVDETADYEEFGDLPNGVAAVICLYLIRPGERTHICSMTPNSYMVNMGVEPIYTTGFCPDDEMRDDITDALDEGNSAPEGGSAKYRGDYYGFKVFASLDKRTYGAPILVDLDDLDADPDENPEAWRDEIWKLAQEEADCNRASYEPDLLNGTTYGEYLRDKRDAGAAGPRPLDGWFHGSALPLFAASTAGMTDADVRNAKWLS